jgi:hypothetical protein
MFEEIVYFAYHVSIGFLWIISAWGIGKAASYAIEALHSATTK